MSGLIRVNGAGVCLQPPRGGERLGTLGRARWRGEDHLADRTGATGTGWADGKVADGRRQDLPAV